MNPLAMNEAFFHNEDIEARREHERYQCKAEIKYQPFSFNSPEPVIISKSAQLEDISLDGLAIETQQSLSPGELLLLEINDINTAHHEELTAVIMWCEQKNEQQFKVGLRVVSLQDSSFNEKDDVDSTKHQHQLVCPSCDDVSFFLREISSDSSKPDLYHCCHCTHSHSITEVMAFNRQLKHNH